MKGKPLEPWDYGCDEQPVGWFVLTKQNGSLDFLMARPTAGHVGWEFIWLHRC